LSEANFSHVIYGVGNKRTTEKGRFNVLAQALAIKLNCSSIRKKDVKTPSRFLQITNHAINDVAKPRKPKKHNKLG